MSYSDTDDTIRKRSGWLIPLGVFLVTIALSALMLLFYLVPNATNFLEEQVSPTSRTDIVALQVHDLKLWVPANYLQYESSRQGGEAALDRPVVVSVDVALEDVDAGLVTQDIVQPDRVRDADVARVAQQADQRLLLHHRQDGMAPGRDELKRLQRDLQEAHRRGSSLEEPDVVLRHIEVQIAKGGEADVLEHVA